jgi:hypothetical protein
VGLPGLPSALTRLESPRIPIPVPHPRCRRLPRHRQRLMHRYVRAGVPTPCGHAAELPRRPPPGRPSPRSAGAPRAGSRATWLGELAVVASVGGACFLPLLAVATADEVPEPARVFRSPLPRPATPPQGVQACDGAEPHGSLAGRLQQGRHIAARERYARAHRTPSRDHQPAFARQQRSGVRGSLGPARLLRTLMLWANAAGRWLAPKAAVFRSQRKPSRSYPVDPARCS